MDNSEHDALKGILDSLAGSGIRITHSSQPSEVTIPAHKETFEAQVLVITKERKEMQYPTQISMPYPLPEISRVLAHGKFHVELVKYPMPKGRGLFLSRKT